MKCPLCKTRDSLLLLTKVLCINERCENFDEGWCIEVMEKDQKKLEPLIKVVKKPSKIEPQPFIWSFDRDD